MNKSEREKVFNKYGGKCSYCGCDLEKGWHVDHVEPVVRKTKTRHQHWKHKTTGEIIEQSDREGWKRLRHMDEVGRLEWQYIERKEVPDGFHYPERHTLSNMIPACASCNINKHGDSIEGFRSLISGFINSLNRDSTQYKLAKRFGLLSETGNKVEFYFEKALTSHELNREGIKK